MMRTLSVSISEIEYNKFGLKDENLSFAEIINMVSKELIRENLNRSLELANKYGLSTMTMEEITDEVRAVRIHAKNSN